MDIEDQWRMMSLTTRRLVFCCTILAELSSTQDVVAVIGAQTLEEHRAKLGPDAEDVQWHDAPPTVTSHHGNGTKLENDTNHDA